MAQRWIINESLNVHGSFGLTVFSPLHDVGMGPAEMVAYKDLEALRNSDVVFAIVDGLDPGTLFEIGYARSIDIPVVCLAENVSEEDVKMLKGSDCFLTSDFSTAVYATGWQRP